MNNLKAIYDYLNKTNHSGGGVVSGFKGGDFWTWLKYTFEGPPPPPSNSVSVLSRLSLAGAEEKKKDFDLANMNTLSLSHTQTPITKRLDSQDAAALKEIEGAL